MQSPINLINRGEEAGPAAIRGMVRWTPVAAAAQTVLEGHGVVSVVRDSIGLYTIQCAPGGYDLDPWSEFMLSDNDYHEWRIVAVNQTLRTIQVRHRTCTYATIVSAGPVLADPTTALCKVYWKQRQTA